MHSKYGSAGADTWCVKHETVNSHVKVTHDERLILTCAVCRKPDQHTLRAMSLRSAPSNSTIIITTITSGALTCTCMSTSTIHNLRVRSHCRSCGVSLYVLLTGRFPFSWPGDADPAASNVKRMQKMFARITAGDYIPVPEVGQGTLASSESTMSHVSGDAEKAAGHYQCAMRICGIKPQDLGRCQQQLSQGSSSLPGAARVFAPVEAASIQEVAGIRPGQCGKDFKCTINRLRPEQHLAC